MNIYLKRFLRRGIAFGGFGPIILGIVFLVLSFTVSDFSLGGREVFLAIVSTYVLAFVQAGASVFNQIEEWPLAKCTFVHFLTLYVTYVLCYLINSWTIQLLLHSEENLSLMQISSLGLPARLSV